MVRYGSLMRTLQGAYRRHVRLKTLRRTLPRQGSSWFAVVRHDSPVSDTRPHTRDFSEDARKTLGLEVQRAREAAGHPYRPSFADLAGAPLGVRTLLKLEKGEPVGAPVYEAAGRALGRLYQDWSVDTPLRILNGEPAPKGVLRGASDQDAAESSTKQMPDPADYPDRESFFRAVILQLRKQGMSEAAIFRAVAKTVEELEQSSEDTEGIGPDTQGGRVS